MGLAPDQVSRCGWAAMAQSGGCLIKRTINFEKLERASMMPPGESSVAGLMPAISSAREFTQAECPSGASKCAVV